MTKLTKRAVESASIQDKTYCLWDDELRGFGLRIWPTGHKVYLVKCRVKGRQRFITLGPHGPVSPEQARSRAYNILSEAKKGRDPAFELDQMRKSPTVKALCERFMRDHVAVRCKPRTQAEYQRNVDLFIVPRIGSRKVTDIGRADIAELHGAFSHIPYQANRTLGVLSLLFNLAEVWNIRPDGSNPCLHVKKYPERKRARFLSVEEYKALGQALHEAEHGQTETASAINAIRLLMLTGCRLNEIMTLRWDDVYLADYELRLPDSKTGAKTVHIGQSVVDILVKIERINSNPYVITGKNERRPLTDLQHPWRRIRAAAGLPDVRIHDLRHSFASGALALGEGLPMIGKLLGHSQVQTTARYAHLANAPIKVAASRIADSISEALRAR
ncbi:Tyrosine recombinase XerC (plasmid) [Asticcacaulis sp. MM231]|uniref:tyrosine-type recombinase/integrase n=1 Tax=Asticcacaulis sp. MM231 TaxID=3157666 RepID=UPI0032D57F3F